MTKGVSEVITPRQLITVIFVVAAYTSVFLAAVVVSDLFFTLYELHHKFSYEVSLKLGSSHDVKMRIFSALLSMLAILVELDTPFVEKSVPILKFFIPRSLFLLLIATLSELNPMISYERKTANQLVADDDFMYYSNSSGYDRDLAYYNYYNSYNGTQTTYNTNTGNIQDEIPEMIVSLPLVSATFL